MQNTHCCTFEAAFDVQLASATKVARLTKARCKLETVISQTLAVQMDFCNWVAERTRCAG